ncbi:alpha/beta-hydrolase [Trametes cingulata]|nr:alpha/beta-hydrolase [Trametes cingulata]
MQTDNDAPAIALSDVSGAHRVFLNQLVLQVPRTHTFNNVSALENAADLALDWDASLLLLQQGARHVNGVGDVRTLASIKSLSRALFVALHEVLKHVEVAVARVTLMQSTIGIGLTLLEDVDVFRSLTVSKSSGFARVLLLSEDGLSNSVRLISAIVDDALSATTTLGVALHRFRPSASAHLACNSLSEELCNSLSTLSRGPSILSSIFDDLMALKETLEEGPEVPEMVLASLAARPTDIALVHRLVEVHLQALNNQLLFLWWMRQGIERAFLTLSIIGNALAAPTVTLDKATVIGTTNGTVTNFFGIPYAQPPVGDLRLRLPKPVTGYSGIINATQDAAQCPQIPQVPPANTPLNLVQAVVAYANLLGLSTNAPQSEDCLTVNVQVPTGTAPGAKLPVLALIYGGGFVTGSTALYRADALVRRSVAFNEPVIVVAMNYRLGGMSTLGFLGGKEVKEAGIGNLGLQDQRLALKWIQKYVSAFGGDPQKVTIWGESAGSVSVSSHMITNGGNTEGLFRGAIMHSGSPPPTGDIEELQPFYDAIVANTTCKGSNDTLDCLRKLPLDELMAAASTLPTLFDYSGLDEPWAPRADGVFFETQPQQLVLAGSVAKVPFLTGDCLDEGTVFSVGTFNVTTDAKFRTYVHDQWFPNAPPEALSKLFTLYPNDPAAGSPFGTGNANELYPQFKRISAFQGDLAFQSRRRFFLDHLSTKQPAWSFISKRDYLAGVGVTHASEFARLLTQGNDDLAAYVIHFAATLDPNGASHGTIDWPRYDSENRQVLTLLQGSTPLAIERDTARLEAMNALTELLLAYPI